MQTEVGTGVCGNVGYPVLRIAPSCMGHAWERFGYYCL